MTVSCTDEDIMGFFARLSQAGSLEAALNDAVRLACKTTGSSAGALLSDAAWASPGSWWVRYDPGSQLDGIIPETGSVSNNAIPRTNHFCEEVVGANQIPAGMHTALIALECCGRTVGRLLLLASELADTDQIRLRIAPLDTVLATLVAAATAVNPLEGLLTRPAFRARVASEIARSERRSEEFCILHIRLCGATARRADVRGVQSSTTGAVAQALVARLRKSDVVGQMAPDHLAILLTATEPVGARIAQQRIKLLLPTLNHTSPVRNAASVPPEFYVKCFPADAVDVGGLCHVDDWASGSRSQTQQMQVAL